MENWSSVIYKYERGEYTAKEALETVNRRIKQSTKGSVAIKRLRQFRKQLLKEV